MPDYSSVLGISSQMSAQRLTAAFVQVDSQGPTAVVLDPWRGTKGIDPGRQLAQLVDVLRNRIEHRGIAAISVKRIESPMRRPPGTYDDRIRFEGAVMLAAVAADLPYYSFRKVTLKSLIDKDDPYGVAATTCAVSGLDSGEAEALAAALAALRS
jgi:hypothetical protein